MKKFKLFAGAAAALAMGILPSCSDNDISQVQKPDVAEVDSQQYMTVVISSPTEKSRSYEIGSENESAVHSFDFIFYDRNGHVTAKMQSYSGDRLENSFGKPDGPSNDTNTNNVSNTWKSVVPVQITQGQNIPYYVVCLVNVKNATSLENKSLDELRDEVINYFSDNNYFTMANSTYFGNNPNTGESNARICATPIRSMQLYETEAAAQAVINDPNASKDKFVNIYVERLAAKVGLAMATTAPQEYTLDNTPSGTIKIKFVPEYWFMNATAKENYVTKRYGIPNEDGTINMAPQYTQINEKFTTTGMPIWNLPEDYRSFWGCSPSYYEATYPIVSDQVNDLNGNTTPYTVNYYSYNDVKAEANKTTIDKQAISYDSTNGFKAETGDKTSTGFIYTRETTTAIGKIKDEKTGNPAASVGSAVIVGHYLVNNVKPNAPFYIDVNATEKGKYYANEDAAITELVKRQTTLYTDDKGTTLAGKDVFQLIHPTAQTRAQLANINIPGRLVTIQIKDNTTTPLYWYNGTNYELVSNSNISKANAQLISVGYMDMYYNGLAYFSVPIRHLGFPTAGSDGKVQVGNNTLYDNGTYYWTNMRLGDLGIVRNHVYTLTVNKISGLGTGIRHPNQPILPPKDVINQWVAVRLNILSWNVVNNWSVDL